MMRIKNKLNADNKARGIIKINKNLISVNFGCVWEKENIKEMICAFNLSIEFCDTILNSLKWYNIKLKLFYKEVKSIIQEEKILFIEQENRNLKYLNDEKENK